MHIGIPLAGVAMRRQLKSFTPSSDSKFSA
jgi:hypothetical protein